METLRCSQASLYTCLTNSKMDGILDSVRDKVDYIVSSLMARAKLKVQTEPCMPMFAIAHNNRNRNSQGPAEEDT